MNLKKLNKTDLLAEAVKFQEEIAILKAAVNTANQKLAAKEKSLTAAKSRLTVDKELINNTQTEYNSLVSALVAIIPNKVSWYTNTKIKKVFKLVEGACQ